MQQADRCIAVIAVRHSVGAGTVAVVPGTRLHRMPQDVGKIHRSMEFAAVGPKIPQIPW